MLLSFRARNRAALCALLAAVALIVGFVPTAGAQTVEPAEPAPNAAPSVPGTPATDTSPNNGAFTLTWAPSTDEGALSYTVLHKRASNASFSEVASGVATNSYTFGPQDAAKEAEGTWTYKVVASDGLLTSDASAPSGEVVVDRTAPTVANSAPAKMITEPTEVELTASEPAEIHYSLDGSLPSSLTYSGPITLRDTATVKYVAVDRVGNASGLYSDTYVLRRGAPDVGPIDVRTGFPLYYADETGLRLGLCLDQGIEEGIATPGKCLAALPDPSRPARIARAAGEISNFDPGTEAFWFAGEAAIDLPGGGRARLVLAEEAAFANEALVYGDQISFGRVRYRIDGLRPGRTYTVVHPYGEETYIAEDKDGDQTTTNDGIIRFGEDIGCIEAPCDFSDALESRVSTFLRWDRNGDNPGAGYIGDPAIDHEIVGSPVDPAHNVFRIEGPGVGGGGVDFIETETFTVQGRMFDPSGPLLGLVRGTNQVNFGRVAAGSPKTDTVTLTNGGVGSLNVSSVEVTGADRQSFNLSSNSCPTRLGADALCDVTVAFDPARPGDHRAFLTVVASGETYRIPLLGSGKSENDLSDLRAVGPIDLANGYPLWYSDESDVKLALCVVDEHCLPPGEPFDPARPLSFPNNFPHEAFWWAAEAGVDTNNGERGGLVLAQEAAFLNEEPAQGDQMTFGRVRVRIDGLGVGEYKVTHPFGVETFELTAADEGVINFTEDIGCMASPCDFHQILDSRVGPFLKSLSPDLPEGYIGDPAEAFDGAVSGSPYGTNLFRVEGPNAYGPDLLSDDPPPPADGCPTLDGHALSDCVETTEFSLAGKLWATPAEPTIALRSSHGIADFGRVPLGWAAPTKSLVLSNEGQGALEISDVAIAGASASDYSILSNSCSGASLGLDETCTVEVDFEPGGTREGARAAALQITSNAANHNVVIDELGAQVTPPNEIPLRGLALSGRANAGLPGRPDLRPVGDSGLSSRDNITNATSLQLRGAAAPGGATVDLTVTDTSSNVVSTGSATVSNGAWSYVLDRELPEGAYSVVASIGERASAPLWVTIDRTGPAAPLALALAAGSDSGLAGDNLTNDATPSLEGTAEVGTQVELLRADRVVGSSLADAAGNFSVTSERLADGVHEVSARATDVAGNAGAASAPLSVEIDTVVSVSIGSKPPASSSDDTPSFTFSSSDATAVFSCSLSADADAYETCVSPKDYGVTAPGTYTFKVTASDAAGNVSPADSYTFTIVAPPPPPVQEEQPPPVQEEQPPPGPAGDTVAPSLVGAVRTTPVTSRADGTFAASFDEIASWRLVVGGAEFTGNGSSLAASWNGFDGAGARLRNGMHGWTLSATDSSGNVMSPVTGDILIDRAGPDIVDLQVRPRKLRLERNRPLRVRFSVTEDVTAVMRVKNPAGRNLARVKQQLGAADSPARMLWDGTNGRGNPASSGSYRIVLVVEDALGNRSRVTDTIEVIR